jgi:hypothetical protein
MSQDGRLELQSEVHLSECASDNPHTYIHTPQSFKRCPIKHHSRVWASLQGLMDSMYIAKLKDSNFATHGTRFHQDCVGLDVTQQNHFFEFVLGAYDSTLSVLVSLQGESVSCPFPPFFSSLALLNITVNPSAEAGSLTSHSPNLGKGRPASS